MPNQNVISRKSSKNYKLIYSNSNPNNYHLDFDSVINEMYFDSSILNKKNTICLDQIETERIFCTNFDDPNQFGLF